MSPHSRAPAGERAICPALRPGDRPLTLLELRRIGRAAAARSGGYPRRGAGAGADKPTASASRGSHERG